MESKEAMTLNATALNAVAKRKVIPSDQTKIIAFFKSNKSFLQIHLMK